MSEEPFYLPSARRPRRPGRPRKADLGHVAGTSDAGALDSGGREAGTGACQTTALLSPATDEDQEPTAAEKREARRLRALTAVRPRLLDVPATAVYIGIPEKSVYDLASRGVLRRVRIPLPGREDYRKVLFDQEDVDRLIESWKDPTS